MATSRRCLLRRPAILHTSFPTEVKYEGKLGRGRGNAKSLEEGIELVKGGDGHESGESDGVNSVHF